MAAEIAWPMIRHDYETTLISFRKLAAKHGIRSTTTICRRVAKEGWERQECAILGMLPALSDRSSIQPSQLATRGPAPRFPWKDIRTAYETQPFSVRELAAHFGVSESRIRFRRDREGWAAEWETLVMRRLRRHGQATLKAFTVPALPVASEETSPAEVSVRDVHTTAPVEAAPGMDWEDFGENVPDTPQNPLSSLPVRDAAEIGEMDQAHTDPAELTDEERRAAQTGRLLKQIETARELRDQALALLRLVGCALTDPDPQQRRTAAQRLGLGSARGSGRARSAVFAMLQAAMGLSGRSVSIERHAVELLTQHVPHL